MKIALIADIHANLHAFEAVLGRCALQKGDTVAILAETQSRPILPLLARLAVGGGTLYLNLKYVSVVTPTAQQDPAEYAELMLAAFQHMQSRYGFVPDAIEVILEPENTSWRAPRIGQAIAAAAIGDPSIAVGDIELAGPAPRRPRGSRRPGWLRRLRPLPMPSRSAASTWRTGRPRSPCAILARGTGAMRWWSRGSTYWSLTGTGAVWRTLATLAPG